MGGGHIGTFSCLALARGCNVIVFEPNTECSALLKHNVQTLPSSMRKSKALFHHAAVTSPSYREEMADTSGKIELLASTRESETYRSTLMREKNGQTLSSADLCCGKCGLRFRSQKLCKKHEVECKRTGKFTCSKCGLPFKTAGFLRMHKAKCTGPRKFAFDYMPAGRVRAFTLPEILKAYPQIEGVKIDIEGCELDLLEEMLPSQWGNVKRLVFEYSNEYDDSAVRYQRILKNLRKHFVGGVIPKVPCRAGRIDIPKGFAMVVRASTEALRSKYSA